MAPSQKSPKHEGSKEDNSEKDDRKRVGKACDRCRLKKSKCDGQRPCNRCRTDDNVCMYGERKKITEKVYPKGYIDQLVADHDRLIKCVHKLYEQCLEAEIPWDYPEVERETNGGFLTHNILKSMNLLQHIANEEDDDEALESFEDDPKTLLKRFQEKEETGRQQHAATKQESSSPSPIHDTPMQRHYSMSRTPSDGSIQYGGQYPMLDRSQQPSHIPIPHFGHTPNGGFAPPTPGESPSRDGTHFQLALDHQLMNQMNTLNQPTFGVQPQNFSSVPLTTGMYAPAYGTLYGSTNYAQPPIHYSNDPSPYLQHPGLPSRPPAPAPPQGGSNRGPKGDPFATLAQNEESPTLAMSGIPNQEQVWSAASLPTATDPLMGFDPEMELQEDFGDVNFGKL